MGRRRALSTSAGNSRLRYCAICARFSWRFGIDAIGTGYRYSRCLLLDASRALSLIRSTGEEYRTKQSGWVEHYYEVAEIIGDLYPAFGEIQVGEIRDVLRETYTSAGFGADYRSAAPPLLSEFWSRLQRRATQQRDLKRITRDCKRSLISVSLARTETTSPLAT